MLPLFKLFNVFVQQIGSFEYKIHLFLGLLIVIWVCHIFYAVSSISLKGLVWFKYSFPNTQTGAKMGHPNWTGWQLNGLPIKLSPDSTVRGNTQQPDIGTLVKKCRWYNGGTTLGHTTIWGKTFFKKNLRDPLPPLVKILSPRRSKNVNAEWTNPNIIFLLDHIYTFLFLEQ